MAKSATTRVDDSIREGKKAGSLPLTNLLTCIERILKEGDPTQALKRRLGGQISLGNYSGSTPAKKAQRHLVRAILLCEIATGIGTASNTRKSALKAKTVSQLKLEANGLTHKKKAEPTRIQTVSCLKEQPKIGSGNLVHKFSWGSSTGNLDHLAYIPTREMVVYDRLRVGDRWVDIPLFGKEHWEEVDRLLANPWHPEKMMMPDNPSCPGDVWNGPLGGGTDKHSQAQVGPILNAFLKGEGDLVDSEYWAVQEYQYNATGNPATWVRDYHKAPGAPPPRDYRVSDRHPNDTYWKVFPRGKWVLKRRVHQHPSTKKWLFTFTKQGFEESSKTEIYETTVPILG